MDKPFDRSRRAAGTFLGAIVALALAGASTNAQAATYFVCGDGDTCNAGAGTGWSTGDDDNTNADAQSRATPWQTIDHAEENVGPGDTVIVGDGVYRTSSQEWAEVVLFVTTSGTPGNPITYRSENKWGAVIAGVDSMYGGIWFGCRASPAPSYIHIQDFDIWDFGTVGVHARDSSGEPYDSRCTNLELTGLRVREIGHSGIVVEAVEDVLIANNVIYDIRGIDDKHNQYHGVYISDNTDNVRVENNVIYDVPGGWPVHIYDGHGYGGPATNHIIVNNTLVNTNAYRSGGVVAYGVGHIIRNNIMLEAVAAPGYEHAISETEADSVAVAENNLTNLPVLCKLGCTGATSADNALNADLSGEFTDSDGHDYRLLAGALSVDTATATNAPAFDILGTPRPQGGGYDIGAYELPVGDPPADAGAPDSGSDSGDAEAGVADAGASDAGATDARVDDAAWNGDTGVHTDATMAASDSPESDSGSGSGCSCIMTRSGGSVPRTLFLVIFLGLIRHRVRRHRVTGNVDAAGVGDACAGGNATTCARRPMELS